MKTEQAFNDFLNPFIAKVRTKSIELKKASWDLETNGSEEKAKAAALASKEYQLLFTDDSFYQELLAWKNEGTITSPELLRVLNLLIQKHKANQVPKELLSEIAELESQVAHTYVKFRPIFEDQEYTENDLLEILKTEENPERRKEAWNATKQVGNKLAPLLLKLIKKRNSLAHRHGYSDFYQMRLEQNEIDKNWLFGFLQKFDEASKEAYAALIKEIDTQLSEKFKTTPTSIGPWAWRDPFCQEDPLAQSSVDESLKEVDIVDAGRTFFSSMGFDVDDILERSDLFEREGKNQHAFCTNIDRDNDIRTLCNIRPNIRWLETIIHELGHAVYEKGYDPELHWYLKCPPHMITTEAIALITGRHAYDSAFLKDLVPNFDEESLKEIVFSQKRRQLIFSRWVLVMVHFESALYANPEQDLNSLWWKLVQKYQRVCPSSHRGEQQDWASKCHFGIAPVYYHSYLLGEFFASMLKEHITQESSQSSMYKNTYCKDFLNQKLFYPGNRMRWDNLIQTMMGKPLEFEPWMNDFCNETLTI